LAHVVHIIPAATAAIVVLLLPIARLGTAHHHALGFLLTFPNHEFFSEMLILHTQFLAYLHQPTQAINVVRRLLMNIFIYFKCFIEQIHASVAGGYHKLPLDLFGLDLESTFKVNNGLFKLILLGMMHP
jgi:hypothetical protein